MAIKPRKNDISRNEFMLTKGQAKCGYDWWWHSFTAHNAETGEERPFFLEFFVCNPATGGDEPVFGQLPENKAKGIKPSYLMIKVGCWGKGAKQIHRFFGWNKFDITPNKKVPFEITADDCFLTETKTYGKINLSEEENSAHPEYMCDAGDVEWDLKIKKIIPFNVGYGAGKTLRNMQAFEMFWHVEGMKTEYEGEIVMDGVRYIVDPKTCYGYADKNWGKNFTSPWVWLSSCNLTSKKTGKKLENSAFDIGGGRPKIGPVALNRQLLSLFDYEGELFEFNFSKLWDNVSTKFECRETDKQIIWHVEQSTWNKKMVTDITCEKDEMLFVNYEAPTGEKRHNKLWNGGNGVGTVKLYKKGQLVDEITCENVGCEYGEFDPAE